MGARHVVTRLTSPRGPSSVARMGRERRDRTGKQTSAGGLRFGPANYAAFACGAASIMVGYVLLDRGSVTAAPLLLVLGYAILLPAGLLLGWRRLG